MRMINTARGPEALSDAELNEAFGVRWPEFRDRFEAISASAEDAPAAAAHSGNADQSAPEDLSAMLGEVQKIVRGIAVGDVAVRTHATRRPHLEMAPTDSDGFAQKAYVAARTRSDELGNRWLSNLITIAKGKRTVARLLVNAAPFPKPVVLEDNGALRLTISLRCSDPIYQELLAEVPALNDMLTAIALHDTGGRRVELTIKQLPEVPAVPLNEAIERPL